MDAFYLLMYAVGFAAFGRSPLFFFALIPFAVSVALPDSFFHGLSVVFAFCAIASLYLAFSVAAFLMATKVIGLALLSMAGYCFIFAIDGWVNSNVETWIYINHEAIVAVLHFLIILSTSKRLSSMVGNAADTCVRRVRDLSGSLAFRVRLPWGKSQKGNKA